MFEIVQNFYDTISIIDLLYLIITTLSVIKCYNKGFVLSILAASKWILAYIVTLILFPRVKPYFKNIIDSEYVLDVVLGVVIFILVVFIILMINKGVSKAVRYSGLGSLDSIFGLFFGFVRGYIVCVLLFSAVNIVYNYNKWPIKLDSSYTFQWIEKAKC